MWIAIEYSYKLCQKVNLNFVWFLQRQLHSYIASYRQNLSHEHIMITVYISSGLSCWYQAQFDSYRVAGID